MIGALDEFTEYIRMKLDKGTICDIASYGMAHAGVAPWIYYQDNEQWYHEHQSLIEDALHELIYDVMGTDLVDVIYNNCTKNEEMMGVRMVLSWFLMEWVCTYIMEDLQNRKI